MTAPGNLDDKPGSAASGEQRLDKWLWFARIVKSRTLAANLVLDGKIRVNRVRVTKPSLSVKPGDVVTSAIKKDVRVFKVLAPGVRRGPPPEARCLYEELTPSAPGSNSQSKLAALGVQPDLVAGRVLAAMAPAGERRAGSGRPTKRDRRRIDRLKGQPPGGA